MNKPELVKNSDVLAYVHGGRPEASWKLSSLKWPRVVGVVMLDNAFVKFWN